MALNFPSVLLYTFKPTGGCSAVFRSFIKLFLLQERLKPHILTKSQCECTIDYRGTIIWIWVRNVWVYSEIFDNIDLDKSELSFSDLTETFVRSQYLKLNQMLSIQPHWKNRQEISSVVFLPHIAVYFFHNCLFRNVHVNEELLYKHFSRLLALLQYVLKIEL